MDTRVGFNGARVIKYLKSSFMAASNDARLLASASFVAEHSSGLNPLSVRRGTI